MFSSDRRSERRNIWDIEGAYKPKKTSKVIFASQRIENAKIQQKTMFYNSAEEKSITKLRELLEPKGYIKVLERLSKKGIRTGFTCLLYGSPGTGKTETVYQLAKDCGRDIYMVEVSQIKSMWVGESEKNITNVFDRYKKAVKDCNGNVPILLFNEADAVFGQRMENTSSSADKMENSVQNIILQKMEDFEGILIATTNFTTNLDAAFERRFLYKIHFHKPEQDVKTKIWKNMIPDLSTEQTLYLSQRYDFSGGQIENICRKREIDSVLNDTEPSFEQLCEYCDNETIGNKEKNKIGF